MLDYYSKISKQAANVLSLRSILLNHDENNDDNGRDLLFRFPTKNTWLTTTSTTGIGSSRQQWRTLHVDNIFLLRTHQCLCEKAPIDSGSSMSSMPPKLHQTQRDSNNDRHLEQQIDAIRRERERLEAEIEKSSCRSCLYTGVATCLGLAGYFVHLAYDEKPLPSEKESKQVAIQRAAKQRPYFLVIAAGWIVIGAYRWHLG